MPAVPGMHATLHDIAAAVAIGGVVIVGIVVGVVWIIVIVVITVGSIEPGAKRAKGKSAAVMETVMETTVPVSETALSVPETTTCECDT